MPKVPEPTGQNGSSNASNAKASTKHETVNECVFVVDKGVAKTVTVKRGIADDNYVEITSGLKGGEEIVSGSFVAISRDLNDGSKVRIENNKTMAMKTTGE